MTIPSSHIQDAQKLSPDAEIDLFVLTPAGTNSKIYFKNDNTMTWLGNTYTGMPLSFTGESKNAEGVPVQPQLVLGQPDIDLSAFKGLIWDGTIDNAKIERYTVLLTDLINNVDIKQYRQYRVKRVDSYGASEIILALATFSTPGPTRMPFRTYIPPAFPFVRI